MTKRKEIMELMKDLPNDETWVERFMERLEKKEPVIYNHVIAGAKEKLVELEEKNT